MSAGLSLESPRRDLVMLPGWSLPPAVFATLLPRLSPRFRVTTLALPPGRTLAEMATRALDAAPANAVWFGWSLGGMVAAQAALLSPSRVSGLLTLASNLSFVARETWPHAMPPDVLRAFADDLVQDPVTTLARFDALQCRGGTRAELRGLRQVRAAAALLPAAAANTAAASTGLCEDAAPAEAAVIVEALRDGLHVLATADLRRDITALACPSVWLYAEHDALVPVGVAAAVRGVLPQARVDVLAAAGHPAFFSAADRVVEHLDFLITELA